MWAEAAPANTSDKPDKPDHPENSDSSENSDSEANNVEPSSSRQHETVEASGAKSVSFGAWFKQQFGWQTLPW